MDSSTPLVAWTVVMAIAAVVLAIATIVLAVSTVNYTRLLRQPNVSAFFEASGNWINLVVQNSGSDTARDIHFAIDLTVDELADIYGQNKHGQRYIVFESLDFLQYVTQLAPGESIAHRWLHRWAALRDNKPRNCTFSIRYDDGWGRTHHARTPFALAKFGVWDGTHVMEAPPLESIADSLHTIAKAKGGRESV